MPPRPDVEPKQREWWRGPEDHLLRAAAIGLMLIGAIQIVIGVILILK